MKRAIENPIITIKDIKPSNPNLKVDGCFNCGATIYNNQTVLLLRIAESANSNGTHVRIPVLNDHNELEIMSIDRLDPMYNFGDSRTISNQFKKVQHLTSLSHFRRAISSDGIHFEIDDKPRSEEHTSELQSRPHLVCRLLLEKKKQTGRSPERF